MKRILPYVLTLGIAATAYASNSDIAKLVMDNSGKNTKHTEKVDHYGIKILPPEGFSNAALIYNEAKDPAAKVKQHFILELYTSDKVTVLEDKNADWSFEKEFVGAGSDEATQRAVAYDKNTIGSDPSAASITVADAVKAQLEKFIASKK